MGPCDEGMVGGWWGSLEDKGAQNILYTSMKLSKNKLIKTERQGGKFLENVLWFV